MTTDITELTQESSRESGSILIIVAARMARREFFTPLHALCESGKRVVSTRALCDAVERAEEHMVSQASKIVDGHDRLTKKLKEAESRNAELVEALEKAHAENTAGVAGIAESYETTISMLKSRIAELESRTVTEWIEHDGKWRPESLGLDELVYLKTRKQELKIPYPAGKVKGWMNTGGDMDVMAYKLASPQASTVTVKLLNQTEFDDPLSAYQAIERCKEALAAAGIKVEAE